MPVTTPQSLDEWHSLLATQHLPILDRTRKQIEKIMANPNLSITMYADPIHYDAGFCAEIFREVNQQRAKADKLPLTTLASALSHFGQQAFKTYVEQCQLVEGLDLQPRNLQGYLRTMQQSCHAGLQARDWSQQRNVAQPEEPQLAALMQSITELMLWCYGDTVMPKIEELYYIKKLDLQDASQQVLGCSLKQLGSRLAETWALPEMAADALNPRDDDFTLATGVSLAYEMSRVVSVNWYGERQQQIFSRIARYKGKAEGEIERRIHLNAVAMTDEMQAHGYAAPAGLLPQLADDEFVYTQYLLEQPQPAQKTPQPASVEKTPVVSKAPAEAALAKAARRPLKPGQAESVRPATRKQPEPKQSETKRPEPKQLEPCARIKQAPPATHKKPVVTPPKQSELAQKIAAQREATRKPPAATTKPVDKSAAKPSPAAISPQLAAAIRQFNQMIEKAEPAHNLIEQAVKMCLLCGVDRSKFFVKIPDKPILASRYFSEKEGIESLGSMKINMQKPNLFGLLMEKPRNLFLNESNQAKYLKSIPDQVRLLLGGKQFFAMSVFVNNHAMGLMYADKLHDKLTEAEFKQFLAICKLLSKGIVQSALNKKKHEASEA